jgi:hypothetical protein
MRGTHPVRTALMRARRLITREMWLRRLWLTPWEVPLIARIVAVMRWPSGVRLALKIRLQEVSLWDRLTTAATILQLRPYGFLRTTSLGLGRRGLVNSMINASLSRAVHGMGWTMGTCGRIVLVIGLTALSACTKPPQSAEQVLARCAIKGTAVDTAAHGYPSEVNPNYIETCMLAHGFKEVISKECQASIGKDMMGTAKLIAHNPICFTRTS